MKNVLLRSTQGPFSFKDTVRLDSDRGSQFERKEFRWDLDNNLRCEVPEDIWERVKDEYADRPNGIQYKHILKEL